MWFCIHLSLQLFQEFPELMKGAPAKKAIKGYNKLAAVLVEYEMLYHQAWVAEVCAPVCTYICSQFIMSHVLCKIECLIEGALN